MTPTDWLDPEPRLTADEIIDWWRKGGISAHLRDGMLRAEGYELQKDQPKTDLADEEEDRFCPQCGYRASAHQDGCPTESEVRAEWGDR